MTELLSYLFAGLFVIVTPLCCYLHAVDPMDLRHVGSISVFGGWRLLFLAGVFADMGSSRDDAKLAAAIVGILPAMASFFVWYLLFWLWYKLSGGTWPTRFPDDLVVARRRRW